MEALLRLIGTIVIVALVAVVNRSTSSAADAAGQPVRCEIAPPGGITELEACVAQSPRDVELLLELGDAYAAANRAADARAMYRRAIAIDPHDAEAQRRIAMPDLP